VGLTNVRAIAGFSFHNVALKNNGTVWVWGDNWALQELCGANISQDPTTIPAQIPGITNAVGINVGFRETIIRRSNGTTNVCGVVNWDWTSLLNQ
jgi:alpha-tubulin suppressor-like RCC1 family protein